MTDGYRIAYYFFRSETIGGLAIETFLKVVQKHKSGEVEK